MGVCCGSSNTQQRTNRSSQIKRQKPKANQPYQVDHGLYNYSEEPLWEVFQQQGPELGCLNRQKARYALSAAGLEPIDTVKAFGEMDRNNDNLVTYEEFRYYVGVVIGDTSMLTIDNLSSLDKNGDNDKKLEKWRSQWNKTVSYGHDKITK